MKLKYKINLIWLKIKTWYEYHFWMTKEEKEVWNKIIK
jgi:hypothetical protein